MTSWQIGAYHANAQLDPDELLYTGFASNVQNNAGEIQGSGGVSFTGTWSLLAVEAIKNSLSSAATTIQARVEGSDVNQTMVIAFGATGNFQDTTNTDSVTQGESISISTQPASGGTGVIEICGTGWKYE